MKVKIRTTDFRLSLAVPVSMAGLVLRWMPDRVFADMREKAPEPYRRLITKKNICMVAGECLEVFKANKGLEIVHVEAADGTFVSVKL